MITAYLHPASVSVGHYYLAPVSAPATVIVAVTVPPSRAALFAGVQRVVIFNGKTPVTIAKGALDELYFVGDFTKDCADGGTDAVSVTPVSSGVVVLVQPSLQGNLGVVKIGALSTSPNAKNSFTFRVKLANGEQIDRTIIFNVLDDRTGTFGKDPDDMHFYAFDMGKDAALGKTAMQSANAPVGVGVASLSSAFVEGNRAVVLIGGLDVSNNPTNTCTLTMTFANTEKITRTMYFTKEDH